MKKSFRILVPVVVLISLVAFRSISENDRYFQIVKNLDIFTTLFKEVNARYVDEVNPNQLIKVGIDAMLETLDPYTSYIPEDDIEDYMTMATGEYGGIGALVDRKNGINTVVMPYEDSPADRAGLKIGDQILEINGVNLQGKNSDEISRLLKGQSNSEVTLRIQRFDKEESFEVNLKREKITINNVPYYGMVTDDVGYIRLTDFTTEAGDEVAAAVRKLKQSGATKMILDLRGNPGGLLGEAIKVSNVFVPKGMEIVSTRGKLESWTQVYKAPKSPVDIEIPLAVLTDNSSASASEIVAGVIQDYDRGVLVGRKTYGKGLVQESRPLAYNSQLKVTTAKYYIPSGRCIQAIDYSSRNPDGSVGKIPDSLKTEFMTTNGRIVFDGGGIDPDIAIDRYAYAPITVSLMRNDLIFDYATSYYYSHPEIPMAKEFDLTDNEYKDFSAWVSTKEYDYTTRVERKLAELIQSAKSEKYYDDIKDQIAALEEATLHNKQSDLENFREEISFLLEQEIASRYYLQRGIIESTFDKDKDLLTAVQVLNDPEQYNTLLARTD